MTKRRSLVCWAVSLGVLACAGDGVTFPSIDEAVLAAFCVRGAVVPDQMVDGQITTGDCQEVPGEGFFESWRVRVSSARSVTFVVSSLFDSQLELFEVTDLNDVAKSKVTLAKDDDSGANLNARLITSLQAGVEYMIVVSGFDGKETGHYELVITDDRR